jgi:hypothetical protein
LSGTVCNQPIAHKVAVLIGLAGGWMGRITIGATQAAEPDRPAWMTEAARKRATENAERLRARCLIPGMIRVESMADLARWDDLHGDRG